MNSNCEEKPIRKAIATVARHAFIGCGVSFWTLGDVETGFRTIYECDRHGRIAELTLAWSDVLNDIEPKVLIA